ncbi:MAG: hypothetical protein K6F68_06015 [Clostridiales bacterium]|nr:hypothetical protein [Clostridiales bacterium]
MRKLVSIFTAFLLIAGCLSAAALGSGAPAREPGDPSETQTPVTTAAPTEAPTTAPTTPPAEPTTPPSEPTTPPSEPTTPPVEPTTPPSEPTTPPVEPTTQPTDTPVDTTPTPKPDHLVILTSSDLPSPREVGYEYSFRLRANFSDAVFSAKDPDKLAATGLRLIEGNRLYGFLKNPGTHTFTMIATSAEAGESVEKTFTLVIVPAGATPAPTSAPTVTPAPTETETPVDTPAPGDGLKPAVFWGRAADTVQYVRIDTPFEIRLVEGLVNKIVYTGVSPALPEGLEIVTGDGDVRYVAIRGVLPKEGRVDFSIDFLVQDQGRLSMTFILFGRRGAETPFNEFPEGRPLVPFGGAKEAILPTPAKKKEEEDA